MMMNPNMMGMNSGMNPGMMNMNPGMMNMNPGMMNMNPNMAMGIGMMGNMNNINMSNFNPMVGGGQISKEEEELWMQGFNMAKNQIQDSSPEPPGPKINIIFNTTQGTTHNIPISHGTTIDEALKYYLKRVGRPDLINDNSNKICFLYNATKLKFGDTTPVEQFFKGSFMPKVVVNDINNLIGA